MEHELSEREQEAIFYAWYEEQHGKRHPHYRELTADAPATTRPLNKPLVQRPPLGSHVFNRPKPAPEAESNLPFWKRSNRVLNDHLPPWKR